MGLFGVVIISNPFSDQLSIGTIFGVLSALCGTFISISLRRLGKGDHPASVALIYNCSGALIMIGIAIIFPSEFHFPVGEVWIYLLLLGLLVSVTQVLLTTAYHLVDAVAVASIGYLRVPLAGLAAYILFLEKMTNIEIIGAGLIALGCSAVVKRKQLSRD